jgi:precorrin-6Y C5,15-methyltransferase (decarboxylating)
MHIVSLTGRPWDKFDEALIRGEGKIGLLTDNKTHTPHAIAARMLDYGYDNYTIAVGELLGNKDKERVSTWKLPEVMNQNFAFPNNIILQQIVKRPRPFGIPENHFHLLNGREKMITKMPVRLFSLSMLDLRDRQVFWDIGFCTGSVSIEAKLQFPQLKIYAFEKREEGRLLMYENSRKFGTPGIETFTGDFTEQDLEVLPLPDAVFIGGHGGRIREIISKLAGKIKKGGTVVFNSVSDESRKMFTDAIDTGQWHQIESISIQVDDFYRIDVLKTVRR